MDLHRQFNAVKWHLFPWSRKLSQNVAKNAIIQTGPGAGGRGLPLQSRKSGTPGHRVGFPKHLRKGRHMSFTPSNGRDAVRVDARRVYIPVIGWVRMREEIVLRRGHPGGHRQSRGRPLVHGLPGGHRRHACRPAASTWASNVGHAVGRGRTGRDCQSAGPAESPVRSAQGQQGPSHAPAMRTARIATPTAGNACTPTAGACMPRLQTYAGTTTRPRPR